MPLTEKQLRNFMRHVDVNPKGCWTWIGARKESGYGVFDVDGRTSRAHRIMWEHEQGPIPSGQLVCHTCDHPWCVNPSHLYLGTKSDNERDAATRHRVGRQKLNPSHVEEIRQRLREGYTQAQIATEFGVDQTAISQINVGKTWSYV